MLAQALLSGNSSNSNVILKDYIKTETNPSYLWAMDDSYNGYIPDDDFTGIDGEPANPDLWTETVIDVTDNSIFIFNNKLQLTQNVYGSFGHYNGLVSNYGLSGDFDIQVDFSDAVIAPNTYLALLIEYPDTNTYVAALNDEFTVKMNNGSAHYFTLGSTFGALRLIRSGSVISAEGKIGNGEFISLTSGPITTEDITAIKLEVIGYGSNLNIPFTSYFDNFKVNSVTAPWSVEEEIVGNHGETIDEPIAQQPPLTAYSLPTDKSFLINGSTQAIDTNLTVSSQASRTVLMTFEMTAFPEPQQLFSDGDYEALTKRLHLGIDADYWAWIVSDGVDGYGNSDVYPHNLVVGEKYIVAYVIDGHDISIYVNGVLSAGFTIPNDVDPATGVGNLIIGKDGSENIFYGNFYVDLFVVYDEALSLYDIRASASIFLNGSY